MLKILDLFSGVQSVKKAFPNCDYKGIDIYNPDNNDNIILDLSQDNIIEKLKEKLGNWKPDFIWASPLCITFSRATCIPGGTLAYEMTGKNTFKIREKFNHITHKNYINYKDNLEWQKQIQKKAKLGLKLLENTIKIVEYFNVPFAIENPANALSRYVIPFPRVIVNYCMYGNNFSNKRTGIYIKDMFSLVLKKCNHKGQHKFNMSGSKKRNPNSIGISGNKDRSKVPPALIKDIITQMMKGDE